MPERPEYEFLRQRKFRVRTIKLRGQISQGLVLPLSVLPAGSHKVGDDVTELLGITKYDPQAQQEQALAATASSLGKKSPVVRFLMRFNWYRKYFAKSKRKGGFPEWIAKTDETRIQNMPQVFEAMQGKSFSVTEKMDGQSATYYLRRLSRRKFEFGVCSRNVHIANPDNSSYWTIAKRCNMEHILKNLIGDHESVVLQGEICGDGIQKNKYHIGGYSLFVFNLIYPGHKCTTSEIAERIRPFGLKTVPLLETDMQLPETIQQLVEYSKGYSVVRRSQKREGVVLRSNDMNVSFKVINPEFLLTEED